VLAKAESASQPRTTAQSFAHRGRLVVLALADARGGHARPLACVAYYNHSVRMFKTFRAVSEALDTLSVELRRSTDARKGSGDLAERIEGLELSRAKWEAEIEALLLKAGGKLQASNNAESRARTMKRNYEDFFADGDVDIPEAVEAERLALPPGDAQGSEANGLLALPVGVETDGRSARIRAKFGL